MPASFNINNGEPNLFVFSFTTAQICSNDSATPQCCSDSITFTIRTLLSNGSVNPLGFATIADYTAPTPDNLPYSPPPSQRITLIYNNRSFLPGEEIIQYITLEVTATLPSGIKLIKTQQLKLINCKPNTPEPWLTIGPSKSVGALNNTFKSAVHEGD